jgi:hypothetical protein
VADSHSYALPPRLADLIAGDEWAALAFTPVPVRRRHDGWTPARQRGFILRLALAGNVAGAARAVGKTPKAAYDLRARPGAASFAAAWDRALGWGCEQMHDLAIERSLLGEVRPVFYRGRRVGERIVYDNRLLLAALRAEDRRHDAAEKKGLFSET